MPPPRDPPSSISISAPRLLGLAFRNLRRHGLRAAVNIFGIGIAVASLVFFQSFFRGTYEGAMFASVIDYATSQAQLTRPELDEEEPDLWLEKASLLDEGAENSPALLEVLRARASGPPTLAPRLLSPAFAGDGSRRAAVLLAGVDFEAERRVFALEGRLVSGAYGSGGVLIGKKLATVLSLSPGDEIRLQATTTAGAPNLDYWRVGGIYSTGYPSLDRALVFLDLRSAQSFLGAEGKINKLYCRIAETSSSAREGWLSAMAGRSSLGAFADLGLSFHPWQDYAKGIVEDARSDGLFYGVFIGILLFLSLSTTAGTMRMSVFERRREIGMLRATGWLRGEIGLLFLFEALLIGLAGSAAGDLAGGAASLYLETHPIGFGDSFAELDIPSFALSCALEPSDLILSGLAGLLTSLAAGLLPARAGARLPVLSALSER